MEEGRLPDGEIIMSDRRKPKGKYSRKRKKWIHKAIKKPGRVRRQVYEEEGDKGFYRNGDIKPSAIKKAKAEAEKDHDRSLVDADDLALRFESGDLHHR